MKPTLERFVVTAQGLRRITSRGGLHWNGARWRNATPPINPLLYGAALVPGQSVPYWDMAVNKAAVFSFANQAAVTFGVGLSTTVATLSLSNDNTGKRNLAVLQVSFAFSAAPAAATVVALVGGSNAANVTHTTPGTVQNGVLGVSVTGISGKIDTAATLPSTPVYLMPVNSVVAASSITPEPAFLDLRGALVIPPGAFVAFQATAACTGFCGIVWTEI